MIRAALLVASLVVLAGCEGSPPPEDAVEADSLTAGSPATRGSARPGELAEGDSTIVSGEFADEVRFTARRGQRLVVDMVSKDDLDTYLILRSPASVQYENDDYGESSRSRVEVVADSSGTWRAIATSYEVGATGPYTLRISVE